MIARRFSFQTTGLTVSRSSTMKVSTSGRLVVKVIIILIKYSTFEVGFFFMFSSSKKSTKLEFLQIVTSALKSEEKIFNYDGV